MVLWMTGQSWYDEGLFYPHSQFGSKALRADAYETVACAWLSLTTLVGLILNAALGCWWADPVAALVLVPLVVREGLESLRGDDGDD
jgi:divalent metal cation (Fe/Co/Zn/Cd) transporter